MTQTSATIPLRDLKPGHEYPGASVNARVTDRDEGLEALKASIKTDGLLQSLLVTPSPKGNGGGYYVIAGNRRLRAMRELKMDFDVPVMIRADVTPGSALALSLAENITQVPLHPVDRFEAFAAMIEGGKTEADIEATYAISERQVKKCLALGRLSPVVRKAWREGNIDAAEAKAFTLGKDHATQDAVFKKLGAKGGQQLSSWQIRTQLVGNDQDAKKFITFVGRKAYEEAGGKMQDDLFSAERYDDNDNATDDGKGKLESVVLDFALVVRLAGEKLEVKCKELIGEGWGWAKDADDLPNDWRYKWKKLVGGKSAAEDQKKKAGCVLSLDYNGKLEITYGIVKPGVTGVETGGSAMYAHKTLEKKKTAKGESKAPTTLSNSLKDRLRVQRNRAVKESLLDKTLGEGLQGILARIAASQIDVNTGYSTTDAVKTKLDDIVDALPAKIINAASIKHFDAKDYFPKAPIGIVLKAIGEAVDESHVKTLKGKTKSAAWKFALANVPKTGWLPAELRTAHYTGPGAKKAKKK